MRLFSGIGLFALACAAFVAHAPAPCIAAAPGTYVNASERLGIDVRPTGERDTWGHGAAFVDVDGDGHLELYVIMQGGEPNRLFRFDSASQTFADVGFNAGCADILDGRGVVFADYDNDGDPDLFIANDREPDKLYNNDGKGIFSDVSTAAGVDFSGRSHSAAWGDFDNDGYLDLFVCSYGIASQPIPNRLYHNLGDGTFEEVAAAAGVDAPGLPGLGVVWFDYDNDNDLDLYVANDKFSGNRMFRNNQDGTFTDVSAATGTLVFMDGMGIAVGDYDHNGYLDLYVTNTPEGNVLLGNNGNGTFTDVTAALGVFVHSTGWGTAFFDYDNDADDDLYVVNWSFGGGTQAENVLFRNDAGTFTNVAESVGVNDNAPGYGLTVGDYNDDGFIDIFVNNQSDFNGFDVRSVFYEAVPTANHWIKIKTVGTTSNRDGIGAVVRLSAAGISQIHDVRSGSSYLSQLSPDVEFGLAGASVVTSIEITWPSGIVDQYNNVGVDRTIKVYEDAVAILSLKAGVVSGGGIELRWSVESARPIDGFRVYRAVGSTVEAITPQLLDPMARSYVDDTAEAGVSYRYSVGVVQGVNEWRSQDVQIAPAPLKTALDQNYPNPFNPSTTITFSLSAAQNVKLAVYDGQGRRIVTLMNGALPVGPQVVSWDGTNADGARVSSGVYFYRLETATETLTRKMVLVK